MGFNSKIMKNQVKFLVILLFSFVTGCYSQNIDYIISEHIEQNNYSAIRQNKNLKEIIINNSNEILSTIENKWDNFNLESKINIVSFLEELAIDKPINFNLRKQILELYSTLIQSKDEIVQSIIIESIKNFEKQEFSQLSKNNIDKLFSEKSIQFLNTELYRLAGFLELIVANKKLREEYLDSKNNLPNENIAIRSLARMGNKEALDISINNIEQRLISIDNIEYTDISKDCLYIRKKETLNILIEIFLKGLEISDISKPSVTHNVSNLIIEDLIKFIKNYPDDLNPYLKENYEGSPEQIIKSAKKWIRKNRKNLEIDLRYF